MRIGSLSVRPKTNGPDIFSLKIVTLNEIFSSNFVIIVKSNRTEYFSIQNMFDARIEYQCKLAVSVPTLPHLELRQYSSDYMHESVVYIRFISLKLIIIKA